MKKCLILGCSFSSGSYYLDFTDGFPPEQPAPKTGYYSFIDIPDIHYTIYSIDAGGYLNFASLFADDTAQRINLKEYDFVIIQETFEPRIHISKKAPISFDQAWRITKTENFQHNHHRPGHQLLNMGYRIIKDEHVVDQYKIWKRYKLDWNNLSALKTWWHDVCLSETKQTRWSYVKGAVTLINHILKENNTPCFIFSFHEGTQQRMKEFHTWCKPLNIPSLDKVIYKNENWHNYVEEQKYIGHPTEEGCKHIGKLLTKALQEVL
jgi:hypothetical protein